MLNPLVSGIVYGVEAMIVYLFFSRIAVQRFSPIRSILIALLLFELGSVVNILFQNNLFVNLFVSAAIKLCFSIICFDLKLLPAICYAGILTVLNVALESVAVLFVSALAGASIDEYNSNLALLIVECSSCKSLLFVTCMLLSGLVNPRRNFSRLPASLFFYPVSGTICTMIFGYICMQEGIRPKVQYLLAIASVIVFASTVLLFVAYQHQIERESEQIRLKSENDRLLTEKSYYDILEQQNQQLMMYAHDAKNHLAAIQSLSDNCSINAYVVKLSDQLKAYSKNCHSGNMMLDVMIHKYALEAEHRGIRFEYDVRGCNLSAMEDIDLVAVLGNLMDNAVAAAEKSAKKRITLETTVRNSFHVIILYNSCDSPPKTSGERLLTSKPGAKLHGYGLKSVSKTLKKYQGDFTWNYDEKAQIFTATVMIGAVYSVEDYAASGES